MNGSGYSAAAQNYITALDTSGNYDIKLHIFGGNPSRTFISDEKYEYFMKMTRKEQTEDRILIYHCIPNIQKRVKKYGKNIGFATYETFSPPIFWSQVLNQNDAIIVPSQFNYKIFSHMNIQKPIFHIPHCIDINLYHKDVIPLRKYDKFTFLFIGTWKERKGYKNLVEAWCNEFSTKDNVQLLIKTDLPKRAEQYILDYQKSLRIKQGFAPIIIENKVFDEVSLPKFMKSVDCLIAPHMGEGFFVPGLQCMALRIPVIVTNFSGCQDYANQDTAILLEPGGFVWKNEMDGIPQFRSKKWAFVEVKQIQSKMRYVVEHLDEVKLKTNVAYDYVRKNFNYTVISELFTKMVQEIYG
jgi:glycosyltransferase involved in cell wall biosynthesis